MNDMRTKAPKLNAFRDCFEASMDFETALGCAGLADKPTEQVSTLRDCWNRWEATFNS